MHPERTDAARRTRPVSARWLWLFLLPLPLLMGYAESGDPLATMSQISNRAAKGDRLSVAHPAESAWTSCSPARRAEEKRVCPDLAGTN